VRAVVQRVTRASVSVDGQIVGAIEQGFLVLLGVGHEDGETQVTQMTEKLVHLRVFEDDEGKMNLSLLDVQGSVLVVSQFTLYADIRKGRRPSFTAAAVPAQAEPLVERFFEALTTHGLHVQGGVFGAHMDVSLTNNGPVTIIMDSDHLSR